MSTTLSTAATTATPSPSDGFITVPPGLAKVVVTETALGDVRGDEGFYHYRQYSAVDLAERVSFEEAAHLLLVGHLPDADELATLPHRAREPAPPASAARRAPAGDLPHDERLPPGAAHRALGLGRHRRPAAALRRG